MRVDETSERLGRVGIWRFRRVGAALAVGLVLGVAAGGSAAATPSGTITEFSGGLPTPGVPTGIAAGLDGNLWFTNQGLPPNEGRAAKVIGRITPAGVITASLDIFAPPGAIAPGPDGNLWFAVGGSPVAIGRVTPAGVIERGFFSPNTGGGVGGIATGPDGNVWLAVGRYFASSGEIVRITPAGAITEFPTTALGGISTPVDIAAGPDGNLWFAVARYGDPGIPEYTPGAIGRITPTGVVTIFSEGLNPGSDPRGIAAGPDGNVWFTDGPRTAGTTPAIGRITPAGTITEFSGGLNPGSAPGDIALGADGNLWFTDHGTTPAIGRITPAGAITEFASGLNAMSGPGAIAAGPDGNLWFTDQGATPAIGTVGSGAPAASVSAPAVRGAPFVGSRLSCGGDAWSSWAGTRPRRDLFAFDGYRWRRDGVLISGPPSATYTPRAADKAHRISCEITVTYPLLAVSVSEASRPVVIRRAPLTLKTVAGTTLRRGGRAAFSYRVKNATGKAIRGVVITNTLPRGLGIDATSRRMNLTVKKPLRFVGGARKVIFKIGTIAKGATVVVTVNAKVAATAAKGRQTNTVVFWGKGVVPMTADSSVTIK